MNIYMCAYKHICVSVYMNGYNVPVVMTAETVAIIYYTP